MLSLKSFCPGGGTDEEGVEAKVLLGIRAEGMRLEGAHMRGTEGKKARGTF